MNVKAILSFLLSVLLLSSCAFSLRPSAETDKPDLPETREGETEETPDAEPSLTETDPPETDAAGTERAETLAPETLPPETLPPETLPPETLPPETEAPEPIPPETEAPETEPAAPEPEPEPPAEPEEAGSPEAGSFERGATEGTSWRNGTAGLRYILPSDEWRFSGEEELAALNATLPEGTFCDMQAVSEAGSSVLVTVCGAAGENGETVSAEEYAAILTDGMRQSGGGDVTVTEEKTASASLAGDTWVRTEFALTYYGEYEGRSVWLTKTAENGAGEPWFVTVAATGSPADWMDPDVILSTLTSADAPLPPLPSKPAKPADPADAQTPAGSEEASGPARFRWGEDSLEGRVYRNPFAGIAVTAADGWTFATANELAELNGLTAATEEERAREADRRDIRYPMRLSRDGESAEIRLGFIYLGSMAEEWWRYAEKLVEDLTAQGQQAGFDMSSDKGEDVELAGAWWFSRTVTYAKGGEVVGHRVMLWRVVEGELVELVLDDGVWSEETPDGMKRMIGRAG